MQFFVIAISIVYQVDFHDCSLGYPAPPNPKWKGYPEVNSASRTSSESFGSSKHYLVSPDLPHSSRAHQASLRYLPLLLSLFETLAAYPCASPWSAMSRASTVQATAHSEWPLAPFEVRSSLWFFLALAQCHAVGSLRWGMDFYGQSSRWFASLTPGSPHPVFIFNHPLGVVSCSACCYCDLLASRLDLT